MNRITKRITIILILAAVFSMLLIPGCALVNSGPQRDLDVNRAKWEQSGIKTYELHLRVNCFCPPNVTFPVIIKVQNGINVSVEYAQEPKEVTNDFFKPLDTIDELFDIIQKSIDDKVASLVVEYDTTYGYPRAITIDRIENAIDDEIAYFIEAFIPVP